MKIALAQLNYTINDIVGNTSKIEDAIQRAKLMGAELVVFSELSVCGYPPHDFLESEEFVQSCYRAVEQIAKGCVGIHAIVGAPVLNPNPQGKLLYNAALLLGQGKVLSQHHKALLPTYDIFDEYRYFEPASTFEVAMVNGTRVAITVCEDLWDDQPVSRGFARGKLYNLSPMEMLAKQNPELVVNISASPFSWDVEQRRAKVFARHAKQHALPVISVNQVGGNTDLIFDGASMAFAPNGSIAMRLKRFEEDIILVDTDTLAQQKAVEPAAADDKIALIHDALVMGVRDYFQKMGFKKATLGLSGGLDSAVTLAIAASALGPENLRVLLMPSQYSSQHSIDDAVGLAQNLNVKYDIVSIQPAFDALKSSLLPIFDGLKEDLTEENMQARVRGTLLMAISNKFGHLLLNTSNKSEAAVGYGTLYGDMNGALSVLGDVYKTDVFKLAWYINRNTEIIPVNTILKPPSAELRPDQKDSDSLPEYDLLDEVLFKYIEEQKSVSEIISEGFDPATVKRIARLVNLNEYKRFQAPPYIRVSVKAFGFGRRMPLVAKYNS